MDGIIKPGKKITKNTNAKIFATRTCSAPSRGARGMLRSVGTIALAGILTTCGVYGIVLAGDFAPTSAPASTMHSLEELWNKIAGSSDTSATVPDASGDIIERLAFIQQNLGGYTYGSSNAAHVLTLAGGTYNATNLSAGNVRLGVTFGVGQTGTYDSGASGWTYGSDEAGEVLTSADAAGTYDATNLTAARVMNGIAFGVGQTGTLLSNMFNGTSGAFTGGSQANGGADDYNNGGAAASGRYATTWTACNAGNSYCGTGDSGADAKDDATGLIWSLPCNGVGCTSFSDSSPLTYSWDNSHGNNNSRTASELCSDHSGWYLPHQKQLLQAYINGSYGNLEAVGVGRYYWSASTVSDNAANAWLTSLSYGYTPSGGKTVQLNLRCVRPGMLQCSPAHSGAFVSRMGLNEINFLFVGERYV